jgi:hypothetical protein
MTRWVLIFPTPSSALVTPEEIAYSYSKKVEALANNPEVEFQTVNDLHSRQSLR